MEKQDYCDFSIFFFTTLSKQESEGDEKREERER